MNQHSSQQSGELTPDALGVVRVLLLVGVVLAGGIFGFLATQGTMQGLDAETLEIIRLVFFALALGVLGGLVVLRRLRQQADTLNAKLARSVVGYALAEMIAFFGAFYWFLGGGPVLYGAGVLLFGITWLLLPIPADPGASP